MRINFLQAMLGTMALAAMLSACNSSQPPTATKAPATVTPPLEMKQLMKWVIEPQADIVWAAVGSVSTAEGTKEIVPHTDDEWNAVRNSAAIVVETSTLLLAEGRSRGADWDQKTHTLTDTAKAALLAVEAKDADALFTAGGDMYLACSACHSAFSMAAQPAQNKRAE